MVVFAHLHASIQKSQSHAADGEHGLKSLEMRVYSVRSGAAWCRPSIRRPVPLEDMKMKMAESLRYNLNKFHHK